MNQRNLYMIILSTQEVFPEQPSAFQPRRQHALLWFSSHQWEMAQPCLLLSHRMTMKTLLVLPKPTTFECCCHDLIQKHELLPLQNHTCQDSIREKSPEGIVIALLHKWTFQLPFPKTNSASKDMIYELIKHVAYRFEWENDDKFGECFNENMVRNLIVFKTKLNVGEIILSFQYCLEWRDHILLHQLRQWLGRSFCSSCWRFWLRWSFFFNWFCLLCFSSN